MSAIKSCYLDEVNQKVLDYLAGIKNDRDGRYPGIRLSRHRWWRRLLLGLFTWVMFSLAAGGLTPRSLYDSLLWQCLFTTLAVMGAVLLIQSVYLRFKSGALGEFAYFDGSWLWEVNLDRVRVLDLRTAVDVQLAIHRDFIPRHFLKVKVEPGEVLSIRVSGKQQAQEFATFLLTCQSLRQRAVAGILPPEIRSVVRSPGALAGLARFIMDRGGMPAQIDRSAVIEIPDSSMLPEAGAWFRSARLPLASGLVALLAGWLAFPPLRYTIDHRHHYQQAVSSPSSNVEAPRAYLEKFPEGHHVQEVMALLDDRLYAVAEQRAKAQRSPAALRDYLSGQPNERHREEALGLIIDFYDEAILRLGRMTAGQPTEKTLTGGLLAVLKHLKTQPSPLVNIRFVPKWKVLPDTKSVADAEIANAELEHQKFHAARDSVIQEMIGKRGTAILETGETFSEKQVMRRESMILMQLTEAVVKILSSDIISFRRVPSAEPADITVRYEIRPRGTLTKYVRTVDEGNGNRPALPTSTPPAERTLGLLRGYEIDWRFEILPGGVGTPLTYQVTSNPGTNLVYRSTPQDPAWGAYAVMMYSAFHDFSNRVLAGAGLNPPPPPTTFTFRDAVDLDPRRPRQIAVDE